MNYKLVFNRRIAVELRKLGYEIIDTQPNHNNPKLDVYVFEDTEALNKDFTKVANELKRHKK